MDLFEIQGCDNRQLHVAPGLKRLKRNFPFA